MALPAVSRLLALSTPLLWQAVAAHECYRGIPAHGRPEAHVLRDIAERFWGIDRSRVLVDDASTNCGENATFSRRVLEASGRKAETVLIVQDPTMQRRTDATFRHVFRDTPTAFVSWPTFTPQVALDGEGLRFTTPELPGLWPMDRFLSLLLGEIPRLRDDAAGYGPRGKGFIVHVDIPAEVEAAYAHLKLSVGEHVERRAVPTSAG